MKICITGLTGFLGSQITRSLYNSGHDLIAVVQNKELVPDEIKANHKVVRADITKEVEPIDCDLLIHCAALVSEKTLSFYLNKANIDGTRNILNAISKDAKVIHISCGSVYNVNQKLHTEKDVINKGLLTPYGRSKLKSEFIISDEFPEKDVAILRFQNLYGIRERQFLSKLTKIYKNGVLRVPGDLHQQISMTNIDLLMKVVSRFIDVEFKGQEIYNVVDSKIYDLRDVCTTLLSKAFNREIKVREMNEYLLRIVAGLRTVLIPSNQFTQTSIDFLTRDHVLDSTKLNNLFPDLGEYSFHETIEGYTSWLNDVGVSTALKGSRRLMWD